MRKTRTILISLILIVALVTPVLADYPLLLFGDNLRYLLRATFNTDDAAPVANPLLCDIGSLAVTDTANHLSVASGSFVADGGESAWGNPGAWDSVARARAAGRMLYLPLTVTDATNSVEFGWDANQAGNITVHALRVAADTLKVYVGGAAGPTLMVPADATQYTFWEILRDTGCFYGYGNTLLYVSATGTTTPLYPGIAGYSAAFSASQMHVVDLPGWTDYSIADVRVSSPATVTPTYGNELITDPGLEATYTAGLCTSLSKTGSPTVAQSADVHGGTKAQSYTATGDGDRLYQTFTGVDGRFHAATIWTKRTAGTAGEVNLSLRRNAPPPYAISVPMTAAAYTQYRIVALVENGLSNVLYPAYQIGSTGYDTVILDDRSVKAITIASMFGDASTAAATGHWRTAFAVAPTLGNRVGLIANLDSSVTPLNWIQFTHDGTTAYVSKHVGGVYTSLYANATAWAAGGVFYIRKIAANTYDFYYNDVLLTTQTISDAGIVSNTKMCWMTTNGALKPSMMEHYPATVTIPAEYTQ